MRVFDHRSLSLVVFKKYQRERIKNKKSRKNFEERLVPLFENPLK
jgi:hypothetical protein